MQASFISHLYCQHNSRLASLSRPNDFKTVYLTKNERIVKLAQSLFLLIVSIFSDRAKQARNEAWQQFRTGYFLRSLPSYSPFEPTFSRDLPIPPASTTPVTPYATTHDASLRVGQTHYPSFDPAFARENFTSPSSAPTASGQTTPHASRLRAAETFPFARTFTREPLSRLPTSQFISQASPAHPSSPSFQTEPMRDFRIELTPDFLAREGNTASFQENRAIPLPVQSSDDSFRATRPSYADITRSTPAASTSNASQPTTRASGSIQAAAGTSGETLPGLNPFTGFVAPDLNVLAMLSTLFAQATGVAQPSDSSRRLILTFTIIRTPLSSDAIEIHSLSDLIDPSGEPTPTLEMVRAEKLQAFLSQHIQELSCEIILFLHEKRTDAITLGYLLKTLTREQIKELEAFFLKQLTVALTESDLLEVEDRLERRKVELLSLGDQLDRLTPNREDKPDLEASTTTLDPPTTTSIDADKLTIEELTHRVGYIHEEINQLSQNCCQFARLIQGLSQEPISLDHEAIQEKLSFIQKLRSLKRQLPAIASTAFELPAAEPENPSLYSWALTRISKLREILSSLHCKLELMKVEQRDDDDGEEEAYMALSRRDLRGSDFYAIACKCKLPEHESGPIFAVQQALEARGLHTKKDLLQAKILVDDQPGSTTDIELKQQLTKRVRKWILTNQPLASTDC